MLIFVELSCLDEYIPLSLKSVHIAPNQAGKKLSEYSKNKLTGCSIFVKLAIVNPSPGNKSSGLPDLQGWLIPERFKTF